MDPPPRNIRARMAELELAADEDEKPLFVPLWEGVDLAEDRIGVYATPSREPDIINER